MCNKLQKKLRSVALTAFMMCSSATLFSEPNTLLVPQVASDQTGVLGSIKKVPGAIGRRIRKLYDCVIGNDATCTSDEIILTRAVFLGAAVIFLRKCYLTGIARGRAPVRRGGVDADRYAGASRTATTKEQLERDRTQFLNAKTIPDQEDDGETATCCVCFEDDTSELKLDYIPCQSAPLHSDKLCLDCLSILVVNNEVCPLCRTDLMKDFSDDESSESDGYCF